MLAPSLRGMRASRGEASGPPANAGTQPFSQHLTAALQLVYPFGFVGITSLRSVIPSLPAGPFICQIREPKVFCLPNALLSINGITSLHSVIPSLPAGPFICQIREPKVFCLPNALLSINGITSLRSVIPCLPAGPFICQIRKPKAFCLPNALSVGINPAARRSADKMPYRHSGFANCGGKGIRTLDTLLRYTHFPGVLLRPLGHSSKNKAYLKKTKPTPDTQTVTHRSKNRFPPFAPHQEPF